MDNFINSFLQDPILLTAGLVFLATLFILFWVLHNWRSDAAASGFPDGEDTGGSLAEGSNTGLLEARLQEMGSQLADMNRRFESMEKNIADRLAADRAAPAAAPLELENIRKDFERLDAKIDLLMKSRPTEAPEDTLKALENKLEGIHRLLIILTDSGSTPEQQ
jgi:chaperonin cofactor prefoldin